MDLKHNYSDTDSLFQEMFWMFFANIIGLPGHRNKRKSVLEITKM